MTDDPFLQLVCDALELMHPAFVRPCYDKEIVIPRGIEMEFFHQFRKLWDRGIPVGMGLGHIILRPEITPDFGRNYPHGCSYLMFDRIKEDHREAGSFAVIEFSDLLDPDVIHNRLRGPDLIENGLDYNILVVLGTSDDLAAIPSPSNRVTLVRFDTGRWSATLG